MSASSSEALQEAAKDLLRLLQQDPHNKEAQQLLTTLRAQHQQAKPRTPVSRTLDALQQALDDNNFNGTTPPPTAKQAEKASSEMQHQLKLLLGLTLPSDDESNTKFQFNMARSPVGYLDVLYLDEDLRVTKGNRGTIVIVERVTTTPRSTNAEE